MSTLTTPTFHSRTPNQLILISPGHETPGWLTRMASILDPKFATAAAVLQNPQYDHDRNLIWLLTEPRLLKLCQSFDRELTSQSWTASDEALHDDGRFGRDNLERKDVVEDVLEDLGRRGVDVAGFDERSTWSLRAVPVSEPFEIRLDEGGDESIVEVPDRRHVYL
jgi:hypothetical protein